MSWFNIFEKSDAIIEKQYKSQSEMYASNLYNDLVRCSEKSKAAISDVKAIYTNSTTMFDNAWFGVKAAGTFAGATFVAGATLSLLPFASPYLLQAPVSILSLMIFNHPAIIMSGFISSSVLLNNPENVWNLGKASIGSITNSIEAVGYGLKAPLDLAGFCWSKSSETFDYLFPKSEETNNDANSNNQLVSYAPEASDLPYISQAFDSVQGSFTEFVEGVTGVVSGVQSNVEGFTLTYDLI
jgi:hypothetical protein